MYDLVSEKWVLTGGDRHNYFRKETEPYQRNDLLPKRREIMQRWSDFVAPIL
jgi:hypothetical protein